jgi:hypothetical protein
MAAAAARAHGAQASPPPPVAEESVSLAGTFAGALDRLLIDGALKERAYRLWKEAGCGFLKTEHAAWIVASGDFDLSFVTWPHRRVIWKEVWRGRVPANVVAIIHTHPDAADPRPSDGDVATAQLFGVPNYAVSRRGIWKATPDGERVQVDGEAWFVRCAVSPGCGVKAPSRAALPRPDGNPFEEGDGLP